MRSFFTTIVLILSVHMLAQPSISGRVLDGDSNPLPGAIVHLVEEGQHVPTDTQGYFTITTDRATFTLSVEMLGYLTDVREVKRDGNTPLSIVLVTDTKLLDDVIVIGLRASERTPMSYSEIDAADIKTRNLGQDLPIMMNYMTSVVTTTDAGAGVGYTGIRVRGSDATRVNVTINGIPYNDAESQGTFWVNLPDFSSSVGSIQLQRGVGTSTNGSGAFGASLNILTEGLDTEPGGTLSNSFGSFGTRKHTLEYNTGLINEHVAISGRLSRIASDGYVDRARSDLSSYYLQGTYTSDNTSIKALMFGGREETYQAWYGIDSTTLADARTTNFAGYYVDAFGEEQFYDNEVDNYAQDHYQLHVNHKLAESLTLNLAGHYTYGRGYFEQYKDDASLTEHGIAPIVFTDSLVISESDLIRRRWLDNDYYGGTAGLHFENDIWRADLGGGAHIYRGDHYGEVIWSRLAGDSEVRDRYYDNYGDKDEYHGFIKVERKLTENLYGFLDLQFRSVSYDAVLVGDILVDEQYGFFNPKAGLSYELDKGLLYASFARAHREPNRTDFENGSPEPEQLDDFELGYRMKGPKSALNVNGFYMRYQDQLVLTGQLDDVGNAIRDNIGESYRLGLEIEARLRLTKRLDWAPNLTLSSNRNLDFKFASGDTPESFGDTRISFSPDLIAGSKLQYQMNDQLQLAFLSKYVGEQYMSNIEAPTSLLEAYFVNDVNLSYELGSSKVFRSARIDILVNNVFDAQYVSNGYWGPGFSGFYPQAGINFLAGLSLDF